MSAVVTGLGQCFHMEDAPCKVSYIMYACVKSCRAWFDCIT